MFATEPVILENGVRARYYRWVLVDKSGKKQVSDSSDLIESSPPTPQKDKISTEDDCLEGDLLEGDEDDCFFDDPRQKGSRKKTRERIPLDKVEELETIYMGQQYLSADENNDVSEKLSLASEKVRRWFVNRRQKQLAEERKIGLPTSLIRPMRKKAFK